MNKYRIKNFKLGFKQVSFTLLKNKYPTYYVINFWRWLYNLTTMITDYFSLPKTHVRARIDIRKDLIHMATSQNPANNVIFKTGTLQANKMTEQEKHELIQQLKDRNLVSKDFKLAE